MHWASDVVPGPTPSPGRTPPWTGDQRRAPRRPGPGRCRWTSWPPCCPGRCETPLVRLVAARPGMGKSTLALNIAQNAAVNDMPVAIFTLEMSREEVVQRLLSSMASVDSQKLRTGKRGPELWQKVVRETSRLDQMPLFVETQGKGGASCAAFLSRRIGASCSAMCRTVCD